MDTRVHPVVIGGVAAGVLDILAAFALSLWFGGTPIRVLQTIASGVLGGAAFEGGVGTAALGLALHFVIAFGAAATYYASSRRWRALVDHAVINGFAYGVVVYVIMNRIVVPLSRVATRPPTIEGILRMIVIHMFCVGLPIALAVRRGELRSVR
jgi:hypothetical protein